jgi:hypothetical protein
MTIWIFITLASLGAGFLLYALLQFFREPQLANRANRQVSRSKIPEAKSNRPASNRPAIVKRFGGSSKASSRVSGKPKAGTLLPFSSSSKSWQQGR